MGSDLDGSDVRLLGVDPESRRDIWFKKLLYPGHTLPTAVAPALVGAGLAFDDGVFHWPALLAAFAFGYFVQLGGVLADNYFNLDRYRNDAEHPALVHALDAGVLELSEIKRATILAFAVGGLFGTYLLYVGGVPVVVVGLAAIAVSLLYSLEITDLPLHDLYFFLFFGPVSVAGTYYVQAAAVLADPVPPWFPPGSFPLGAVIAGVPIGAITTAILVVDNIRDLEYDRPKDDVTLAVVIGERWSRVEYNLLLFGAYAVLPALWLGLGMSAGVVLPLASLPLAVLVAHRMSRARSYPALLPLSPRTGQVLLVFAALLAVGSTL